MKRWEWMSPVDAAWLRMDGPTNPMMITVLTVFERPLSIAPAAPSMVARCVPAAFKSGACPRRGR